MIHDINRFNTVRDFARMNPNSCICDRPEKGDFIRDDKVSGYNRIDTVKIYKCKRCGNERAYPV